jgi:hypothetical protein
MSKYTFDSDFDSTPKPIDPLKQVPAGPAIEVSAVKPATRAPLAKESGPGRRRRDGAEFSLQWAAGFTDGEGCIFVYKQPYTADPNRNPTYRLGFSITQNDREVLEHFQQGLGVHGAIYPVKRVVAHNRQIYELKYTGINAFKVISILQPHLIRKQMEAQTAIAYWVEGRGGEHPGPGGWSASINAVRERHCQKLKWLK